MKKTMSLLLVLLMAVALFAGCQKETVAVTPTEAPVEATADPGAETTDGPETEEAEPVELVVFAAASMSAVLQDVAEAYKEVAPNVTLVFTFDSSGTLKTQITEGAYCDVFISAGQKQMNAIDVEKNEDGQDYVLAGSRFNLLENQIVLVVPADNPAGIESFDDLAGDKLELLAIGNADVPVGQYAAEILTYLSLYDTLLDAGKLTFGSNTTEVTTQVAEGAVSAGIVYRTDVASAVDPEALLIIAAAPEGSVSRAIYPAAAMKASEQQEAALAFLDYLRGETATALLNSYGFTTDFE